MARYLTISFSTRMLSPQVKSIKRNSLNEAQAAGLFSAWVAEGDVIINCPFESTAKILSAKLGFDITPQRNMITVYPGDEVLQFTLLRRPPEGEELTEEELVSWPSKWELLEFEAEAFVASPMPSKLYLANAFTPAMLASDASGVQVEDINESAALDLIRTVPFESSIGHEATAQLLSNLAGVNVPANRISIQAHPGEAILVVEIALPPRTLITDPDELATFQRKWKLVYVL